MYIPLNRLCGIHQKGFSLLDVHGEFTNESYNWYEASYVQLIIVTYRLLYTTIEDVVAWPCDCTIVIILISNALAYSVCVHVHVKYIIVLLL